MVLLLDVRVASLALSEVMQAAPAMLVLLLVFFLTPVTLSFAVPRISSAFPGLQCIIHTVFNLFAPQQRGNERCLQIPGWSNVLNSTHSSLLAAPKQVN
jgi:hypothetical protein